MYSFCRRWFGIDKEVFQLKIHLFYIKRNETGEIYDPPVLYALTDEKKNKITKLGKTYQMKTSIHCFDNII